LGNHIIKLSKSTAYAKKVSCSRIILESCLNYKQIAAVTAIPQLPTTVHPPHKPFLLLSILDLTGQGIIQDNHIGSLFKKIGDAHVFMRFSSINDKKGFKDPRIPVRLKAEGL